MSHKMAACKGFGRHLGLLLGALGASWAGLGRSWAVLGPLMPQGPVPQDFFALPTSVVLLEPTANSAACECECAILLTLANSHILSTTRYSQTLTVAS